MKTQLFAYFSDFVKRLSNMLLAGTNLHILDISNNQSIDDTGKFAVVTAEESLVGCNIMFSVSENIV
ncbi:hypothetical protein DPMN_170850 [Dreissena polymorpha]|uniref:Uncharacterized protein n=1 Tax=Dreissena polymorpha TaxID=45954 RepID=A0A9D4E0K7_DREPO|nr:hypothetical protein DPMN_170850 [Dreissena polymorpha]